MSNPNVVLIHGNGGATAEDFWYPEVKAELEAAGVEVVARDMPSIEGPHMWLPFIQDELGADENSIIVGHSTGAVAAMRYAETHRIFGSVLVAAHYTDLGIYAEKRSGYFTEPWGWDAIKANQNWTAQFASTNDPFIPIEQSRHIHEKLDTDYHEVTKRGHFTDYVFPGLVTVIKEKLAQQ
jgi:predicted alpha/beta hydrolase family esterase